MKAITSVYREIGRGAKGYMSKKGYDLLSLMFGYRAPLLAGTEPPLWQTPGKVQYYKAEMEPYVPGKGSTL